MKTHSPSTFTTLLHSAATHVAAGSLLAFAVCPTFAADAASAVPLPNQVTLAAGGTLLEGDRDQFQKLRAEKKDGWGGLESFFITNDLGNDISMTAEGRALFGNHDYLFSLKMGREGFWFVNAGFQEYRIWYDGSGGYFPPTNLFFAPFATGMHIDRGNAWIEAGTQRETGINFRFRYDFTRRRGLKDSTTWGDTNLTGGLGTRAIGPAFYRIDEERHILRASADQKTEQLSWQVDGRYEWQDQDNSRNIRRQPLSATGRVATQREKSEVDLFMLHGAVQSTIGPTLTLGAGMAHYDIDNLISGSRIYGDVYDPVFNPTMTRRQARDEGYYDLHGTTRMKQTLANLNLMYTPNENWVIVPELRAQKTTWDAGAEFVETNVGTTAALITAIEDLESESSKSYRDLTEVLEFRYKGIPNMALNASLEATQSYGSLSDDLIDLHTGVSGPFRTTDFRRDEQKVEASAHWYPVGGLSFTAQAYWKGRQNSFNNTRTSTAPVGGDRYPAYISHQDLETTDVNFRVSWSPMLHLKSVSRYDYQETEYRSQEIGLPFIRSARIKTHMFGQVLTWSPLSRLFIQAAGSLVFDQTHTPAIYLTGAAANVVKNGDNNYFNGDLTAGYVVDDKTDLTVSYSYYQADNYIDNSRNSTPYGADARSHYLSATVVRRINENLNYTVRYAYGDHRDDESGGHNNFKAHSLYTAVQYRF